MKTLIVATAAALTAAGLTACTIDAGGIQAEIDSEVIEEVLQPLSIADIASQVGPAVVQLNVYDETGNGGTGSGFVLSLIHI